MYACVTINKQKLSHNRSDPNPIHLEFMFYVVLFFNHQCTVPIMQIYNDIFISEIFIILSSSIKNVLNGRIVVNVKLLKWRQKNNRRGQHVLLLVEDFCNILLSVDRPEALVRDLKCLAVWYGGRSLLIDPLLMFSAV